MGNELIAVIGLRIGECWVYLAEMLITMIFIVLIVLLTYLLTFFV